MTGWFKVNKKWYYARPYSAAIENSGKVDILGKTYYFDSKGVMQTGWVKHSINWYYFDSKGVMQTGWLKLGGKWYYLEPIFAYMYHSGPYYIGKVRYYFNTDGTLR